ncbi:LysR family transcriptional regulator [Cupriavidus sp. L7L]|uniref:LysR family transcriptional regulator n=1 Tax=Cupriavidus sp. L7L TaxID=2546443 RepID=UPI001055591A|nr:LysR substrate-binding domain-containing protein [Cupriavidus sp. L7L]TDF62674.1 LysR family transcriptional regulator [Cupriavidus sp. L7L]
MSIQQLRALMAVVNHGGFRAAARALNVSQGGLTKSIAALEEEYGIDLIDRSAKGVLLTARGESFLEFAKAILEETDRADRWLKTNANDASPTVSLGISIEPSIRLVPAVLQDFRRIMPDVAVRLTQGISHDLLSALRESKIELAVVRLPRNFDAGDLKVERLYQSEPVIVGRAGHPGARATSLRDLVKFDWVVAGDTSQQGAMSDDSIWELFDREALGRPRFAAISNSLFSIVSMLMESDALARVPRALLEHPLVAKNLIAIPVEEPPVPYWIAIVYKTTRRLSPGGQTLVAMISSFARISRAIVGEAS